LAVYSLARNVFPSHAYADVPGAKGGAAGQSNIEIGQAPIPDIFELIGDLHMNMCWFDRGGRNIDGAIGLVKTGSQGNSTA